MARGLLGTAAIRIVADATALVKGFGQASGSVKKFSTSMRQAGTSLTAIGTQAAVVAGTIAAAFAPIAKVGAKFEQSLAVVKAVTGETGAAFDSIAAKARQLGEDTRFTATQAADAMIELGRAGLSASEIISTTGNVLNLASVGMIELSTAAGITTRIMRAFNLTAEDSGRIVDVLTVAANNANTTVELLGESFKFVAPTAASVGVSLEETAAALSVLANAGLRGTLAGTALNQAILQMGKGTEKAAEVLARFGLSLDDVNPRVRSLQEIISALSATSIGAIDLVEAFGIRGGRALSSLVNQGAGALDIMNTKFGETQNAAARASATIEDTFLGRLRRLKSVAESLQLDIFGLFADDAKAFADQLINIVQRVRQWVKDNEKLAKQYTKLAIKIGAISGAIALIAVPLGIIVGAFANIGLLIGPILTGLGGLLGITKAVGASTGGFVAALKAGAAAAAIPLAIIVAVIVVIIRNLEAFKVMAISVFETFKSVFNTIGSLFNAVWAIVSPILTLLEAIFLPILMAIILGFQGIAAVIEVAAFAIEALVKGVMSAIASIPGLTTVLNAVSGAVGWVAGKMGDAIEATKKWVGSAKDSIAGFFGMETAAEKAARAAVVLQIKILRLNNAVKKNIALVQAASETATDWVVVNQQILGIQEKGQKASIAELRLLEQLLTKRKDQQTSTKEQIKIAEQALELLAADKKRKLELKLAVKDLEVEENILKDTLNALHSVQRRNEDATADQGATLASTTKRIEEMIAAQEEAINIQNRLTAARDAAADASKALAKIEESLANVGLTALEAKIKGTIALRAELNKNLVAQKAAAEIQIEQLKLNEATRKISIAEAAARETRLTKELERLQKLRGVKAEEETIEGRIKAAKDGITKASLKVIDLKAQEKGIAEAIEKNEAVIVGHNETKVRLNKLNDKHIKIEQQAVLDKRKAARDELADANKLRAVEAGGDRRAILVEKQRQELDGIKKTLAAKLEAINLELAAEKGNAEFRQKLLDDRVANERAAAETIASITAEQQRKAVELDKKILKEEKDAREKKGEGKRKEELSLEQKLAGTLLKKVQSLRDMLALEKAIDMIRQRRVKRIDQRQDESARIQKDIDRIQKVLDDGHINGRKNREQEEKDGEAEIARLERKKSLNEADIVQRKEAAGLKDALKAPDEKTQAKLREFLAKAIVGIKKFNEEKEASFSNVASRIFITFNQAFTNIFSSWCKLMDDMLMKAQATGAAAATAFNPGGGPLPLAAGGPDVGAAVGGAGLPADPGGAPVGGPALASAGGGGDKTFNVNVANNVDLEGTANFMRQEMGESVFGSRSV